jgi:hypothetical protein
MLPQCLYSTSRRLALAVTLMATLPGVGCSMWKMNGWNLDQLRDERARDIEDNLSRKEPIMANPF